MPIGEFGRPPALPGEGSAALTTPMYWMYEMGQASLNPARAVTDATKILFQNPLNPWSHTEFGKSIAAGCELFERTTRRYGKPEWGLHDTEVNGVRTPVEIRTVWEKPFCRLLYFDRKLTRPLRSPHPRVLIVAPMSGHYATLLRGTVEAFLPTHEVYITDWSDARMVPLAEGRFDLDDYVDYVIEMLHVLGGNMHIIAVCQPSVPVVAAVSIMEAEHDPYRADIDDADGRPDRHPAQSDRGQQSRRGKRHRVVPQQRHQQGAVSASGFHARCLSGLSAAQRLHHHEPRPPHGRAQEPVQGSGEGRWRSGRQAPRFLRRISRGDGSHARNIICRPSMWCSSSMRCPRAR